MYLGCHLPPQARGFHASLQQTSIENETALHAFKYGPEHVHQSVICTLHLDSLSPSSQPSSWTSAMDHWKKQEAIVLQVLRSEIDALCNLPQFANVLRSFLIVSFLAPKRKCNPPSLFVPHPPIVAFSPALLPRVLLLPLLSL